MEKATNSQSYIRQYLLQSEELYKYILETSVYPREPEPLKEIRDVTASHPYARMGTTPDSGQLIALLLKLIDPKKTIEIGIVAIDMDRKAYEIGLPVIKKAGVDHKIEFIESEALPFLDQLLQDSRNEGSFEYAYVDADKDNYWKYHEKLMKLLKIGGVAVYDNTLWKATVAMAEEQVPERLRPARQAALETNKLLAADPRVQLSHVPVGDGLTICRRIS
ncbi:hypothetical protein Patl1_13421 [Pistacia atlantica]|uniref:Uncharacterized protein n=1 Tax=Pistacia atlantica TaxID=434234 RepID=A0ACC1AUQ2_9ROSI|nr:hypothetical protein Patl1_13421 [Pistacia atlantica]